MKVRQSVSFEIVTDVGDEHTELTGKVAADASLRLMISECLPGVEMANCQIVDVDQVQDISIETLEVF